MPIVFVHGVSVRNNTDYYAPSEKARDSFFRRITLPEIVPNLVPMQVAILNPYWGDAAAKLAWHGLSLPSADGAFEAFGSASSMMDRIVDQAVFQLLQRPGEVKPNALLVKMARENSLERAVNVLLSSVIYHSQGAATENVEELGDLYAKTARYVRNNPAPGWLAEVASNQDFATRLLAEVEGAPPSADDKQQNETEDFGVVGKLWESVKNTARDIGTAATATLTNPIIQSFRPALNEAAAMFVGDIFCYLRSREKQQEASPIIKIVADAIRTAHAKRTKSDPLIIVGHSMGGIIAYDLLTSFLKDVTCDVLLTVGSQVGLFEELKLFVGSDQGISADSKTKLVPMPANIIRWINVFDRADVISYRAEGIFKGVKDFEYETGETVIKAHGAYLLQPLFHERLNAHLRGK